MFNSLFLQAGGDPKMMIIMMVGMVAVMYFFMIRPQSKRAKEQKKFQAAIAPGEKIITAAGIHGTITRVNDDGTVQVETGRGNFVTLEQTAVSMEMTNAYRKRTEVPAAVVKA